MSRSSRNLLLGFLGRLIALCNLTLRARGRQTAEGGHDPEEPTSAGQLAVGEPWGTFGAGDVSDAAVIDCVARAFQSCAPASNPLPIGTARALAHVLTHDQVTGAEVEKSFRAAVWEGPPTRA